MLPDETYRYSTCRADACQAKIMWVKFPSGAANPLDPEPTSQGNVMLTGNGGARVMGLLEVEADTTGERFLSHFVTCPARAEFKKRKKAKQ